MPGQGEVVLHPIYIEDLVTAVARSLESINTVDMGPGNWRPGIRYAGGDDTPPSCGYCAHIA